jgi:xanthine dehydrogenase YagT iron-sulfur-binding subunit
MRTESLTQTHPVITAMPRFVTLRINGEPRSLEVLPYVSLLDTLREHLNLTGTKKAVTMGSAGHVP